MAKKKGGKKPTTKSARKAAKKPSRKPAKKSAKKPAKKSAMNAAEKAAKKPAAKPAGGPPPMPPEMHLMQGLFGFMVTKAISAAAALNVPDALHGGPLYYTNLASVVGADQRALHRAMRMLSSAGVFAEVAPGTYANTPVSDLLRTEHPASMRDMAVMITSDSHWLPWGKLEEVLRTGESGPRHAFGVDVFTWFQAEENRGQWEIFNAAMTSFSSSTAPLVAASYDFTRFRKIIDVGGGHGLLLKTVLLTAPNASGVLYDLPGVVEGANGLPANIERAGGDFFQSVPAGGDCYLLKHIIHDWSDDQCVQILRNIAGAMQPDGRVIVVDAVMPESTEPHPVKFMDVNMLAMTEGGCERTEQEFANLFQRGGLKLVKVHHTPSPVCLIEAVKA